MTEVQSSQVSSANHHDANEETSHDGDIAEFQEPVEEPSEARQWRDP